MSFDSPWGRFFALKISFRPTLMTLIAEQKCSCRRRDRMAEIFYKYLIIIYKMAASIPLSTTDVKIRLTVNNWTAKQNHVVPLADDGRQTGECPPRGKYGDSKTRRNDERSEGRRGRQDHAPCGSSVSAVAGPSHPHVSSEVGEKPAAVPHQ
ncbi:hypothetical protein AGR1A_pAt10080 [Agrobacterium fabacearum CFBP 5771]|nr:hypothetical protein AGR1A_pAt10080 [Agrobacterium fabacearum CFBP 5771]